MSAPFMQLYVGDYLGDTRHLTTEQHGAYLLLLMTMWRSEGSLPNDDRKLARIAGCTPSRWSKIKDDVLEFFDEDGDILTNKRLQVELKKASEKSAKRAEAGTRGGEAKARKNIGSGVANARDLLCHSSEPEPEPENKEDANASFVAGSDAATAFDEWNSVAGRLGLPVAKDLTPHRRKAIRARLGRGGLANWRAALAAVEASPHCRGENDRGWRADLDFVLQPKSFQRLVEGFYGPAPAADDQPTGRTFDGPAELRELVAAALGEPFARSYIDPSRWNPDDRTILAANPFAAQKIASDLAPQLAAWKVKVGNFAANDATQARGAAA